MRVSEKDPALERLEERLQVYTPRLKISTVWPYGYKNLIRS